MISAALANDREERNPDAIADRYQRFAHDIDRGAVLAFLHPIIRRNQLSSALPNVIGPVSGSRRSRAISVGTSAQSFWSFRPTDLSL
jgi:hypothetical protein